MSARFMLGTALVLVGTTSLALAEDYASGAIKTMETKAGEILTDAKGMTLYTSTRTRPASRPLRQVRGQLAAADRRRRHRDGRVYPGRAQDGTMQWAYEGKPLTCGPRTPPGDMTGDGMNDVWHAAVEK